MKAGIFLCLFLICSFQLFAQRQTIQQSLVGTWVEESKEVGIKEIKIITPTHMIFMVVDVEKDSIVYAGYGTYIANENTYIENLEYANFEWDKHAKRQFDYMVEGDKFYQKGIINNPNGTKENIKRVFNKVTESLHKVEAAAIGTWEFVSYVETQPDGKIAVTDTTAWREKRIITPTHYMSVAYTTAYKVLAYASYGTYQMDQDRIVGICMIDIKGHSAGIHEWDTDYTIEKDLFIEKGKLYIDGELWKDTKTYKRVEASK